MLYHYLPLNMSIIKEEHVTEEETFPLSLMSNDNLARTGFEEDPLALPEVKKESKVVKDINKNESDSKTEVFLMTSWNENSLTGPIFKKEDATQTYPGEKIKMKEDSKVVATAKVTLKEVTTEKLTTVLDRSHLRTVYRTCYAQGCLGSNKNKQLKFFSFPRNQERAQLWAERLGIDYSIQNKRTLHKRFICSRHFSENDFTTAERKQLNRIAVPSSISFISVPHSAPEPIEPSECTPFMSSLPTVLNYENNLHVLTPVRTYSKMSVSSSMTKEFIHVHPDIRTYQQ
ncbi:uncharacterized protein LOC110831743 isoform X2 [Zootermopsis nevadensis]|uniref:uncharacterized protein LOC110831743 isoform X2 n=1 Tax=Zootermopsis nevadensis TaxID=136037 RepID=UPI000B8E48FC|nr:uncharacterized protein LOC110831743 isoform X2 [Zootermopsis nevadensis]